MRHFPNAVFTDSFGSTETGFQGTGLQDASALSTDGPVVSIPPTTVLIGDDGKLLDPAADIGKIGRTARSGNVPVGYYKDPEKSAKTFVEIDGVRYSIPGDFARIEEGNRLTLLGRGSNCINTGGEKVYPEEVEMALKGHPDVYDVLVVGLPDENYGQQVSAVVQPREGATPTLESVREFLRQHVSGIISGLFSIGGMTGRVLTGPIAELADYQRLRRSDRESRTVADGRSRGG